LQEEGEGVRFSPLFSVDDTTGESSARNER
jgi:hypothetical protein